MLILPALLAASQLAALPAPASRVCSAVDVVAPEQEKAAKKTRFSAQETRQRRRRQSFSARETLDLQLRVRLQSVRRLSGDHLIHLKLYTPRGYLYQTITVPFHRQPRSTGGADLNDLEYEATRVVAGSPRALGVQKTTRVRQGRRRFDQVTARLPVAGTSITLGSLFGPWTVVPFLDDGAAPCGPSRQFVIRQ